MEVVSTRFGLTQGGEPVKRFLVTNLEGMQFECLSYGAIISRLFVPDRDGRAEDVVLGFDCLADYEAQASYLGAVIGRYANRIRHGRFVLRGVSHQLSLNENRHHLHGGYHGFDRQNWTSRVIREPGRAGVAFTRLSPHGEEHYPGDLHVEVSYTMEANNRLVIGYKARSNAPTIVNLTQHSYFDLSAGHAPDVLEHELLVQARSFLPVDADLIPTGEVLPVAGTPFDFTHTRRLGARIDDDDTQLQHGGGYDHTWVLDSTVTDGTVAVLFDPYSGRRLEISTTEPGIQCYSGNRLNVSHGKGGQHYGARRAVCLETQHFPDAPSHRHFPSTELRPGQVFASQTTWAFSTS